MSARMKYGRTIAKMTHGWRDRHIAVVSVCAQDFGVVEVDTSAKNAATDDQRTVGGYRRHEARDS